MNFDAFMAFFRDKIWGNKVYRILFLWAMVFLAYYGWKSCSLITQNPYSRLYRIARDPAWAGLMLRGQEARVLGFTDHLIDIIAREEKFRIQMFSIPSTNMLEGLQDDNFEAIVSPMTPDFFAKERFIFSDPFYYIGPVVVVDINSKVKDLQQLAGKTVAIQRNSALMIQGKIPKDLSIYPYDNINTALDDLRTNRIDGVVTDLFYAYAMSEGLYKGKIKIIPQALTNDALRLVAAKHDNMETLIEKYNEGLKQLKAEGHYSTLLSNFQLPDIPVSDQ